jgi:hypothetical protein
MEMKVLRAWPYSPALYAFATALVVASLGASAGAEEVYTANLTAPKGLGKKTAELTLTITERTPDEERAELRKVLDEQGSEAAFATLRRLDRGTAKITGGVTSRIDYFFVHPGQNGAQVVILLANPLYFPGDTPNRIPEETIGLIHITLNNAGKGRGTLAEASKIRYTESGTFEVEGHPTQISLDDIRRIR